MIITTDKNKNEVSAIVDNFKLNLIFNGEYYNTKNGMKKLTINTPIVEFYDTNSDELVDRYYVSAIMAIPDNSGLNFYKSNNEWKISKENLDMIKNWLMQYKCSCPSCAIRQNRCSLKN